MRSGTGKIIVSSPLIEISALGSQRALSPADISPKGLVCVAGKIFVNSRKDPFAGRNVFERDFRFFAQNSRISHFQCGHLRDDASVN